MLSRMYKMAFWVLWDHLGGLLLANAFVVLVVSLPGSIAITAMISGAPLLVWTVGLPLAVISFGILAPVAGAGLTALVQEYLQNREGGLGTIFTGMRRHSFRAAAAGIVFLFFAASLLVSAWFYAARLGVARPWLGHGLSALALWTLVFECLCVPLVLPAIVQKKGPLRATLKLVVALVLDNPLIAGALAASWLGLLAMSIFVPLFLLLAPAAAIVLSMSAYEMMARKYAAADPASLEGAGDDYLNRGLRDLLYPWKN